MCKLEEIYTIQSILTCSLILTSVFLPSFGIYKWKSTLKQNIAKFTININQCKKLLGFYIPFYPYMHIYLVYSKFLQYVVWVQILNKEY